MTINPQTGLYGPYGLWRQPFFQQAWFFWLIAGIISVIFFILLFYLIRFLQKKGAAKTTPVEQAIIDLSIVSTQLKNETIPIPLLSKTVTDILRSYAQRQTGKPAAHYTLPELAETLRTIIADATQQELEQLFLLVQELLFSIRPEQNSKQLGEDLIRIAHSLLTIERETELEQLKLKQSNTTSS